MKTYTKLPFLALSLCLLAYATPAQVSITSLGPGGAYTQDFSVFGTGNFALVDNTSMPGVYAFRTALNTNPNVFAADDGSNTIGQFFNYGTTGDPDRAMGGLSDAGTGALRYGIRFQNDTASTITSIEVQYTGEQWRDASTVAQSLLFDYRVDPGDITDITSGTFTPVASLNFVTPSNSGAGTGIDGNDPANREEIVSSFPVSILPGQEVVLRWTDFVEAISDHGIAIDDVVVIFRAGTTAADATISGRLLTANGRGISGARVILTGGDLGQPKLAVTNAFGYYSFSGLPAGRSYVVTASAKRYGFSPPSRTVDLSDSAFDVNFIAQQ